MDYKIRDEKVVLDDFLKVFKATVEHDSYSGASIKAKRLALDRGDSVAVLIYEKDTDSFLFTEQFRYPSARRKIPFILELVAGAVEDGERPESSALREIEEEIGYEADQLTLIHRYFPTPGMSAEVINLFYTEVLSVQKSYNGGGAKSEQEDIKLVKLSRKRVFEKLSNQEFNNSITIIGLQWFLLNKNN